LATRGAQKSFIEILREAFKEHGLKKPSVYPNLVRKQSRLIHEEMLTEYYSRTGKPKAIRECPVLAAVPEKSPDNDSSSPSCLESQFCQEPSNIDLASIQATGDEVEYYVLECSSKKSSKVYPLTEDNV
jgi:hypothetical protein